MPESGEGMPEAGSGGYRGLDPAHILARQGKIARLLSESALRGAFMTFWALQQKALCHDHCPGITPDYLRVLFHVYKVIQYANEPLVLGTLVDTIVGSYLDEEILWPDHGHWN